MSQASIAEIDQDSFMGTSSVVQLSVGQWSALKRKGVDD